MSKIFQIEMEDDVLLGLQKNPEELVSELRLAAAAKWYELGQISQEKAAQIAGLSRSEFIFSLARLGVSPFQESVNEIIESLKNYESACL